MDNPQILYNWEALIHVLPYLKLSDLLATATISKEWHYHLSNYLKKVLLTSTQSDLHANPFTALKMVYNRTLHYGDEEKALDFPHIPVCLQMGLSLVCITTMEGVKYVCREGEARDLKKKDWLAQNSQHFVKFG